MRAGVENDLVDLALDQGYEAVHFHHDPATGLRALIAIHSTQLGPALGGCRCYPYVSSVDALADVLRLARGMTLKSAFAGLPLGGGKAVILAPPIIADRYAFYQALGDFVARLQGSYITAKDVGTTVTDLDAVATRTRHVRGASNDSGDPSPNTALGVLQGIRAAVQHRYGRDELAGLSILIQGAGHVGYALARLLKDQGARLLISDVDEQAVQRCVDELGAEIVAPDDAMATVCDVFAPCALGGVLSKESVANLPCEIIAGSANNQLVEDGVAQILHERGVLYVPDFVVNAGGLIQVWQGKSKQTRQMTLGIYDRLLDTFARAKKMHQTPLAVVETMALERLQSAPLAASMSSGCAS